MPRLVGLVGPLLEWWWWWRAAEEERRGQEVEETALAQCAPPLRLAELRVAAAAAASMTGGFSFLCLCGGWVGGLGMLWVCESGLGGKRAITSRQIGR